MMSKPNKIIEELRNRKTKLSHKELRKLFKKEGRARKRRKEAATRQQTSDAANDDNDKGDSVEDVLEVLREESYELSKKKWLQREAAIEKQSREKKAKEKLRQILQEVRFNINLFKSRVNVVIFWFKHLLIIYFYFVTEKVEEGIKRAIKRIRYAAVVY